MTGAENGNAAAYFVDRHASGPNSAKIAFIEGDRTLSYRQLGEQSGKMADLFSRFGIGAEDRAAMVVLDTIEFPVIFWGSLEAGVVPVPLNTLLSADYYEIILNDSRAKALFVSYELLAGIAPVLDKCRSLKVVFVISGPETSFLSFETEMRRSRPRSTIAVTGDECAFWLYSSGSTGLPKGVRHVHSSLKATADTFGRLLGIEEGDTVLSAAKLFFAYGLGNGMTFPMAVGATTVLSPARPTPSNIFDTMKATSPTIFCGVPTLYAAMLAEMPEAPAGFDRLRICVSAGEALPADVGTRWTQRLGVEILDGVGSTEMLHIFLCNPPGGVVYGTSGFAVPGYELRLVDEDGKAVAEGAIGELLVKGPSSADGYWNQREKSRSTFEGHWTRTGDKYVRRPDDRLVYCGRTDDMFKVSGIWVSPFEIEQALICHPDVIEAAVIAAQDEHGLDKPKAFVVAKRNADANALAATLKEFVKEKVGKWKYPRWIEIIDELPKTATGKIQRYKLRQSTREQA